MRNTAVPIFPGEKLPLMFGHRGYSSLAPENTLPAFELLLRHSVPGVELDVRSCVSGETVVCHDANLKRLTGQDLNISETEWSRIGNLDAGLWFGERFRNTRIPRLEDVLDLLGDKVYYDIEIKNSDKKTGPLENNTIGLIEKYHLSTRCFISSFNPYSIKAVRIAAPHIRTAIIYSRASALPWYLRHGEGRLLSGCDIIKPEYSILKPFTMFFRRRLGGFPIIPWTVDDEIAAEKFTAMGVDGIISNNPVFLDL
jgi:glycerophosphoryl diester phosphodiesterase